MNQKYGIGIPTTNAEIFAQTKLSMMQGQAQNQEDMQRTQLAGQLLGGKMDAGQYRNAVLNLEQNIKQVNQNAVFWYSNYLRMSSGAKNPMEARARASIPQMGNR
jgi:hypothetical protein